MAKPKLLLLGLVFLLVAAGNAFPQTVSIVSGQGQVTCSFFCGSPFFDRLVVVVKDANGNPIPNASVTWAVSGPGTIESGQTATTTITDSTGQTSVSLSQPAPIASFGLSYQQSTITATYGAATATFYETTALSTQNGALLVQPALLQPAIGSTTVGQAGQQIAGAVQIAINAPNVSIRVLPTDPNVTNVPTAACVATPGQPEGVVLSDNSGTATCNLIFGGRTGTGQFNIVVGGIFQTYGPFNFQVTPGLPCLIRLIGGNNQSGNAGQMLPIPLVAEVTDCGGNALSGIPVTWSIGSGSATFANKREVTGADGRVSTNLTLGSTAGAVNVRVAVASGTQTANNQPVSASFTANVNLVISQLQKIAGDTQTAAQNAAFGQPLVVQVNNQGVPVAGVTVQFAVASGSATVATANAVTNAQGQASTTVTAGPTVGSVTITATIGSLSQTFNLTVRPPGPSNITFLNGAGFQPNFISPCSVATIRASGIATGIQGVVVPTFFGPMPLTVANLTVQFGNTYAPIYHLANINGQESVTVQVPCDTPAGTVPVTIRVGGGSAQVNAQVLPVAPGIFEAAQSDGRNRAVLVKPDGSFVSLENPARRGEIIRMWVTGIGPVTPAVGTNSPGYPDTESMISDLGSVVVGVNNAGVRVVSARYARDLIGVYEVAFEVPSDVPAGNLPLAIAIYQGGNLVFGNPSAIPVQ